MFCKKGKELTSINALEFVFLFYCLVLAEYKDLFPKIIYFYVVKVFSYLFQDEGKVPLSTSLPVLETRPTYALNCPSFLSLNTFSYPQHNVLHK